MDLEFLDPRITEKLLEGHKDTISPLAEEREKFYLSQSCPHCGGNALDKRGSLNTLFRANDPLPRYQLLCENCGCLFDPHSGLILKLGNLGKAWIPAIPILPDRED